MIYCSVEVPALWLPFKLALGQEALVPLPSADKVSTTTHSIVVKSNNNQKPHSNNLEPLLRYRSVSIVYGSPQTSVEFAWECRNHNDSASAVISCGGLGIYLPNR